MIAIPNQSNRLCDGLSRRGFLRIGGLALGGLKLADVFRAEARAGTRSSHKAIIQIHLMGGPPHQDTFDLKPDAPSGYRGEFQPIATKIPGIQICELLPLLAARMDRLAIIRSLVGSQTAHSLFQCETGWPSANDGNHPALGAAVARLLGNVETSMPPFVVLPPPREDHFSMAVGPTGFLGPAAAPFKPKGEGLQNLVLNDITADRLADRRTLLASFDRLRRDADASGTVAAMDVFNQRAFDVLTSSRLLEALDLTKEDPKTIARYDDGRPGQEMLGGPGLSTRQVLIARRLVEAGARCVSITFGQWDTHGNNFRHLRNYLPRLDRAVSALVDDLEARGLLNDVTVAVFGEFGRTPIINKNAGRDHWPAVNCALLAGGGMKTGQVIGETDALAAEVTNRPVHMQELFATLYHNLGIDVSHATWPDHGGRPQYLVDSYEPIRELV